MAIVDEPIILIREGQVTLSYSVNDANRRITEITLENLTNDRYLLKLDGATFVSTDIIVQPNTSRMALVQGINVPEDSLDVVWRLTLDRS